MSRKYRSAANRMVEIMHDTEGATAVILALVLTSLVGFAGLGVETGLWFTEKRQLQTAADAAAVSGAFQLANSATLATIQTAGTAMAVANKFVNAAPNSVAISQGNWNGSAFTNGGAPLNAVRAVLATPKISLLAAISLPTVTIGVQAVAVVNKSFGNACVLALDPDAKDTGISFQGTTTVVMSDCMLAANSPNSCAINMNGNPSLSAKDLYTVGSYCIGSNSAFQAAPGLVPITGAAPVPNPFSNVTYTMPSGACINGKNPTNTTLQPGKYSNITLLNGGPYTLAPGTYYIDGNCTGPNASGNFDVSGATITSGSGANGVTIIVGTSGTNTAKIGSITLSSGDGSLSAPNSGPYSGILLYQDPRATSPSQSNSITASGNFTLEGAIYTGGNTLHFTGNSSTAACLEIVAYQVIFTGTSSLQSSGCASSGTQTIGITDVALAQ